ncbi:MAG TPA: 4-(cytidine 5'-diphospho)-2-C-methyl-D-erythritol kinase [Rhodospirillaceae bacterium]|nr:4-(cytidine 5'-diphospho)-2-C-methyl-D-erythritol kinase [Rhodospirillaceae bacterium]
MPAHSLALAKINLYLHMTGRAENGYHYLDSLVVFTSLYDGIQINSSDKFHLNITGNDDLSANCDEQDNLIYRAAHLLAQHLGIAPNVHIELTKNIPLAGGLGGGSADAAATLLLLKELWHIPNHDIVENVAALLGSDIVACLHNKPVIMRETGNMILPAPQLPPLSGLLINPNVPCPTPDVYKAYANSKAAFSENILFPPHFASAASLCDFLNQHTHNDLTASAIKVAPPIKSVLDEMEKLPHVLLSRLSGSGATCFAIFSTAEDAQESSLKMQTNHPDWWVKTISIH